MGLETVIIKQVVNVAKNTAKIQDAITVMQEKLANDAIKVVEKSQLNTNMLSFDIVSLAKGDINDPDDLLTSENLCSVPPLTETQKQTTQREIDNFKNKISAVINNIDALKQGLITVQQPLQTLEITAANLDNIITVVKGAIKIIKLIPIPTSFPPGVGIPINVLTILSDSLDLLDKLIGAAKGITKAVPPLVASILGMITETITAVDGLVQKIPSILVLLSFLQSKIDLGDNCPTPVNPDSSISTGDIQTVKTQVSSDLQAEIASLGDSSIPIINTFNEDELKAQLAPNSQDPLVYKGFTLTLQLNPNNTFDFPSRRIAGERYFSTGTGARTIFYPNNIGGQGTGVGPLSGPIILFNDPLDQQRYSFSSSVLILVEEMKYKIDEYVAGLRSIANKFNTQNQTQNLLQVDNRDLGIINTGNTLTTPSNTSGYMVSGSLVVDIANPIAVGTITTTIPDISITLKTFGGGGSNPHNYTTSNLSLKKPPTSSGVRQTVYSQGYAELLQNTVSNPLIMQRVGIYDYTITLVSSIGDAGNSARTDIDPPLNINNP